MPNPRKPNLASGWAKNILCSQLKARRGRLNRWPIDRAWTALTPSTIQMGPNQRSSRSGQRSVGETQPTLRAPLLCVSLPERHKRRSPHLVGLSRLRAKATSPPCAEPITCGTRVPSYHVRARSKGGKGRSRRLTVKCGCSNRTLRGDTSTNSTISGSRRSSSRNNKRGCCS